MALSENEQKLAERIVGKFVYNSESDISDCSYIYDINDYGCVEESASDGDTYACRRSESYYKSLYEKDILDDQLEEFEKSFKFFRYEYVDTAHIELYRRGKFSLILDLSDNTVTLTQNKYFQYLSANKVKDLNLTDENLSLIEKYESSKESVLDDLKSQERLPKEKLIESIRVNCAHNFAVKDYASYEYQIEDSQENYNIFRTYYDKLKDGLTKEEREKEEELYQEELKRQIEEQKAERQRNLESKEEAIKKEKDLVAKKNTENFKEFQNKILFQKSSYGGDILYCPYVDENGIVEVKNKSEIFGWDFTKSHTTKDYLYVLEDEFSQENFVGKIRGYKEDNSALEPVIQLYRNDEFSLVYHLLYGHGGYFKVHSTQELEESYPRENPFIRKNSQELYDNALKEYSDFNAVVSALNQKFADAYSQSNVESFIINHNAISVVENEGKSDFITDSKYTLELEQKLIQNFTEYYLKENNYSKEDISRIYDEIERETQDRINRYEQDQVRGEENKKEYKIRNEREIEDAVREKLGIKVEKREDEISFPGTMNIFESISTNKPKVVSHREKINLEDNTMLDLIFKVSEGNPGAVNVVTKILTSKSESQDELEKLMPIGTILVLDDMNIRGSQIWCLFKNVYGIDVDNLNQGDNQKNFDDLVEKINKRDNEMVEKLNDYAKKHYMKDKAVVYGASFIHGDPLKDASSLYFDESEFVTEPALKENSSFMMAKPKKTLAQKIKSFFSRKSKKEERQEAVNLEDDEKDL